MQSFFSSQQHLFSHVDCRCAVCGICEVRHPAADGYGYRQLRAVQAGTVFDGSCGAIDPLHAARYTPIIRGQRGGW